MGAGGGEKRRGGGEVSPGGSSDGIAEQISFSPPKMGTELKITGKDSRVQSEMGK